MNRVPIVAGLLLSMLLLAVPTLIHAGWDLHVLWMIALLPTSIGLAIGYRSKVRELEETKQHLLELSVRDDLTGIANHRGFQQAYREMFQAAQQNGQPLSLLMIDLDHFKKYNDAHGHPAGDKLLKDCLDVMAGYVRRQDLFARFGGEEFAVVLEDADVHHARQIAEWMCNAVHETYFLGEEVLPGGSLTVSIGVASYPEMTTQKNDLLELADRALRKAKRSGRGRVEVYSTVLDGLVHELEPDDLTHINYVKSLMITLQAKDRYTYEHSERVTDFSVKIAEQMGLAKDRIAWIRYGAFLHDIGKIEIDREVLTKPGRLTKEEYEIIKKHPVLGAQIVQPMEFLQDAIPIILYHHERMDGRGYPEGLKGEQIPMEARIVGVADAYDAMTSSRPYRSGREDEYALHELVRCAGTQFDSAVVRAFVKVIETEKGRPIVSEWPDVI